MNNISKKVLLVTSTIKMSLAMSIPVLFIGSITVLLNGFPFMPYQEFLDSFLGGALRSIIIMSMKATVGMLAVFITIATNYSYMNITGAGEKTVYRFGNMLGCLSGFFIIVGVFSSEPDFSLFSGQGVFSALLAGIIGSALFRKFESLLKTPKMVFVDGADTEFNAALHVILPFACVTLCFAAANYIITVAFGVQSLQHLFMNAVDAIFISMHRSYSSGLLFSLLTGIMWWFGIHGNNVLNQVSEDLFTQIIPGEIVSKSFMDTFVNMGGTGCVIGLLVAMIFLGKRSSTKKLAGMAVVPSFFNIGEMLVFGFPIIYNPLMALPFILAPLVCFTNAYIMTKIGFMPVVATEVVWTTPPLMSGYLATGSASGIVVQLANILLSAACYAPFVVMYENKASDEFTASLDKLVAILKRSEELVEEVVLTECEGNAGRVAKRLAVELEESLSSSSADSDAPAGESPLLIKYQPQYNSEGNCMGAEALLRWQHAKSGVVYPPLVIRLAKESGILYDLETYIIEKAVRDSESLRKCYGEKFKLSVNVTVTTLYDKRFVPFVQTIADRYRLRTGNICLEITEETELALTEETAELMKKIRSFGYTFALDDFSMGHTSLQYLQHNRFDIVKLDGNLVKSMLGNERTREIISSIVYLSKSLDFMVLAEYVETADQRDALKDIGVLLYQGYLYSPAIDLDSFIALEKKDNGET